MNRFSIRALCHADSLLPNKDTLTSTPADPDGDPTLAVDHASYFRPGDQVRVAGSRELMFVTSVDAQNGTIDVLRGHGGTTAENLAAQDVLHILGNAALEGGDADAVRFTSRTRRGNWTQIFTKTILVSGSDLAVRHHAVADEIDYQKQERLRELLRDLESTVINGSMPDTAVFDPQGGAAQRRTMNGILAHLGTNVFEPGQDGFPAGPALDEAMLNQALRTIWENSAGNVDLIVVNGSQKRKISAFTTSMQQYAPEDAAFRQTVGVYESDFGLQRVILSRWVPADCVLLLDSSRIGVLPLSGRSFHYKPLAATGDYEKGELIGEYTLELRNEAAHGVIRSLA